MDTTRPRLITAGRVVTPSADLVPGTVEVVDGRIASVHAGAPAGVDVHAPDGIMVPGFIDLQINGAAGVDFLSCKTDADLRRVGRYLASTGVTAFMPTVITSPPSLLREALTRWARLASRLQTPRVVGLHLEGPFLNPKFKGAHPARYLRAPDPTFAAALLDAAGGEVRLVTLAPELPGAHEVIRLLRARGCILAAGHTGATYDQAQAAFDEGVTLATHLFNAMRPVHHRDPGIVVAALQHPQVSVSLIADFVHTHPAIVHLVVRLKGWERVTLVTDAIAVVGAREKVTRLGIRRVRVLDAPRLADGTLAGSILSMDRAVRNVTSVGVPLREVVQMASTTPAQVLGRRDLGRIEEGAVADLLVLDQSLHVRAVYAAGQRIHGES
jgi:N-acetylglucosamine-6-phosphate deacetylase